MKIIKKQKWFPNAWGAVITIIASLIVFGFALNMFINDIPKTVENYKKIEGNIELIYIKKILKTPKTRKGDKKKLVIVLKDFNRPIIIGKSTYNQFWDAILDSNNLNKKAIVYLRNTGNIYENPYQIEIDGKIILPIEFHKKWYYILIASVSVVILIALFFLRKLIIIYFQERSKK